MTEDEIVEKARKLITSRGELFPASPEDVAELEAEVGLPIPSLLKRIYLEISDGYFGPEEKALSLSFDTYCCCSECGGAPVLYEYKMYSNVDETYVPDGQPASLVPIWHAHAQWVLVDFATPEGRIWRCTDDDGQAVLQDFNLSDWLTTWLDGWVEVDT